MKASGFQTRDIQKLVEKGRLVKVKPGLYRLTDIRLGDASGLVEMSLAMPEAVIRLTSGLVFLGRISLLKVSKNIGSAAIGTLTNS